MGRATPERQKVTENAPLVTDLFPTAPVLGNAVAVNENVPVAPVGVSVAMLTVPDPRTGARFPPLSCLPRGDNYARIGRAERPDSRRADRCHCTYPDGNGS